MHELGLAEEIYAVCRASLARHGRGRITAARIAVGELSAVEPDLLRYAWEAVVAEGPDRGARLEIEWQPARQVCTQCTAAAPRGSGTWLRVCAQCGGLLRVESGEALDLLDLEVDLEEPAAAGARPSPSEAPG
jgi:hydrogenase nickel incorporation protein HypA/HybF